MQTSASTYDFNASLERIDEILDSNETFEKRQSIPARTDLTYTNGFYVNCAAIFIDICGSSDLTDDHERPVLAKIYRSFISESIAIMRSAETISEVNIQGDAVWGVFNTTIKQHVEQLIDVVAKLESLINVLNVKLTKKGYKNIKVGIGLDYGRALMVQAGYRGSGINDVVWMGNVVNRACHLAAYGNNSIYDKTIMISQTIYNSISKEYQAFFSWNATHNCYHAELINTAMDKWVTDQNNNSMAKPRVFISSTFYDLRQIRLELDKFIEMLGYEPVRNEEGDIPYGKEEELQEYCYKEIDNIDILVSIIGGRYGSRASGEEEGKEYSISQKELKTAIQKNKQVFIFIQKNVATEYETYVLNKNISSVSYRYVDNPLIYKFIEEVKGYHNNNNIKEFETADDITRYLKEQFAGLFKQFILDNERHQEQAVLRDINGTAKILRDLVEYLKEENTENKEEVSRITRVNHPIVNALRKALSVSYNIYIEGERDIDALFTAYGYRRESPFVYSWKRSTDKETITIEISDTLFREGTLQDIKPSQWQESFVQKTVESKESSDLPF